jgi:hypothetical protein
MFKDLEASLNNLLTLLSERRIVTAEREKIAERLARLDELLKTGATRQSHSGGAGVILSAPYRWRGGWIFKNIDHMWWDFRNGIAAIIRWLPIIWHDRNWDWVYLARVMRAKLLWMADLEEKYGHHTTSLRDARQQRICAELLRRLIEDEYFEKAGYGDGSRWGDIPHSEQMRIIKHSERMVKQDQRYLGVLLGKYLRNWWD